MTADEFPQQLGELFGFFHGTFPERHPYRQITATPGLGYPPSIWLLGSSDYSAEVAGLLGLPFSFAHHFSPGNTMPALARYRASFRPSAVLDEPYAMVAVAAICADTDERADWLAGPSRLSYLRRRTGQRGPFVTPEEAAEYRFTPFEQELVDSWTATYVIGGPAKVRAGLDALAEQTGADELMITTMVHAQEDRLRSYELVAEEFGLAGTVPARDDVIDPVRG